MIAILICILFISFSSYAQDSLLNQIPDSISDSVLCSEIPEDSLFEPLVKQLIDSIKTHFSQIPDTVVYKYGYTFYNQNKLEPSEKIFKILLKHNNSYVFEFFKFVVQKNIAQ